MDSEERPEDVGEEVRRVQDSAYELAEIRELNDRATRLIETNPEEAAEILEKVGRRLAALQSKSKRPQVILDPHGAMARALRDALRSDAESPPRSDE